MILLPNLGSKTRRALNSTFQVKDGHIKLDNIQAANNIKKKVEEEAKKSGKLNQNEIKVLIDGARGFVDTGFGVHNEDEALDLYAKQCGFEVRERNTALLHWPFSKTGDSGSVNHRRPTVVPMCRPSICDRSGNIFVQSGRSNIDCERTKGKKKGNDARNIRNIDKKDSELNEEAVKADVCRPFFLISGAVDGIRDEMWCPPSSSEKSCIDEEWELRTVIVECKHRMKTVHATPSLYDQIQTIAYCLMYDANEADIIQVFRKGAQNNTKRRRIEEKKPPPSGKTNQVPEVDIFVTRISLDDPLMQHRQNWKSFILPRLRSFVDAVYRVRAKDELRKLFLQVVASEESTSYATTVSWDLLHEECPWLRHCDTAVSRKASSSITPPHP